MRDRGRVGESRRRRNGNPRAHQRIRPATGKNSRLRAKSCVWRSARSVRRALRLDRWARSGPPRGSSHGSAASGTTGRGWRVRSGELLRLRWQQRGTRPEGSQLVAASNDIGITDLLPRLKDQGYDTERVGRRRAWIEEKT